VHGGTLTVFGKSPTLGIFNTTLLLSGHLNGTANQFVYDGLSFTSELILDFALPEFITSPARAHINTLAVALYGSTGFARNATAGCGRMDE
jgi:hypothetical protein